MHDKTNPLQSCDSPQRASRRDFLKESSKMLGAGLAFSTLGAINPIFAATQAKKTKSKPKRRQYANNHFT
ncbi:Tat pathway signal sequence domain protein [Helicobacter pullorum MIT 98-5489]|uniref:Tat pathway signal sequence domain protein n=1 Tax=Helicobacter pullorum MIT 98-5489 TaxID=537972 RepID=C5EYI1_9HELI|nr:hypothetical protein [Helicobacter pullorum]EEQ63329.1 Tat pathway signal sequence domain protein [Helicobacter pullorum MIT 98-5489]